MSPARGGGGPLTQYDGTYLECRNLGHVWRVAGYYRDGDAVLRRLGCQRCETERTDRWRRDGERLSARYAYADGYRMGTGEGVKPYEVRAEMMRRATVYRNEAEMFAALTEAAR
jgi:hypothetical protein